MQCSLERSATIFAQLGNGTRLSVVRMLVRAADTGLSVGELQQALGIPASTLSHHLQHLRAAGVVTQEREGSSLRCRVDIELLRAVADYLVTECCAGVTLADDDAA